MRGFGLGLALAVIGGIAVADPLPSWTDGAARNTIIDFVTSVTDPDSPLYVAEAERIAVFDNDGTLWAEQPVYFQALYALDRLRERAAADPSILTSDALRAGAAGDIEALAATGHEGLLEVIMASHSGLSVEAFQADVADWLANARHPVTGMAYDDMVYQPMLELLSYLRDEGFQTWIVSGGGLHFLRVFAEDVYGIPPEQVVGSAGNTRYNTETSVLEKDPGIAFIDDGPGKPVGIDTHVGRRPILVGGNSDGDFEMLDWATAGPGARLGLFVHHTDAEREWAYDRDSPVGRLDRGLDAAADRGWLVVDMAQDWSVIYPRTDE